jgi:ectoine hydroxylase-related dioxygenase (phytanoyl-CoA dioxygenase family)
MRMLPQSPIAATQESGAIVDALAEHGFALIEAVLSHAQIAAAQHAVESLMAEPAERYRWIRQRTYERFAEYPIFVELIEHPPVIATARRWLGDRFHLIAAQCSRNTREDPYAPGAMKIHQDGVCFAPQPEPGVPGYRHGFSAMWYVQDTLLEMGPTGLIPGSHRGERRHSDDEVTSDILFRRPIFAGSLLLFSHYTWHRGALNETDQPRDLITNAYARAGIAKVQLTTPSSDGTERFVPPEGLLSECSEIMRQLLTEPGAQPD